MIRLIFFLLLAQMAHGALNIQSPQESRERIKLAALKLLPPGVRVSVENVNVPQAPPLDTQYRILTPQPPLGVVQYEMSWEEKGRERRQYGSATIHAYAKVAISKTALRHHDLLSHSNVIFEERELSTYQQSGYFLTWEEVLSHRANGYVRPGMVLSSLQVSRIELIEQNQMVDLVYQKQNVRIVAKVKALDAGGMSQWIRVQNPKTRKVLQARVSGEGQVEIR